MFPQINLLPEQEPGIQIVHLNSRTSKGIDEGRLNCCEYILATEVSLDTRADTVEGFSRVRATV
jgi:hypothetical protein